MFVGPLVEDARPNGPRMGQGLIQSVSGRQQNEDKWVPVPETDTGG